MTDLRQNAQNFAQNLNSNTNDNQSLKSEELIDMMGDRTVLTLEEIQLQLSSSPEYSDFEQNNGQNINPKLKVQWSVVDEGSSSHHGLL